ncbi:Kef-type potassium/proton antiporter (CPA2 family) [Breoghania corrubedonensis]|uniref:Kef-type potassium/proton antiporter (CPA2 family) n=1 Tax=Breoghania corrubedonensis TaxID=665038 RepID=A0A2T5VEV4_9HYPH|nr:monovalent cation:proton antiporter-2 (CPA2) family protein [Breoghania corrubedonensis]PTW62270.1 Kef-type potassium/proton antiporter (CPA2 family) [Breoghania corrubedonensis]
MATEAAPPFLLESVVLLGTAVIAVPLAKRLGLGAVLGYLGAGILIGPHGLGLFRNAETVLQVSELGVVLLLFLIGLELTPSRLWHMRRDIFGLGTAQVVLTGLILTALISALADSWRVAAVAGFGMALSSTAFALQLLQERGQLQTSYGQRAFAILLLQDIAIVPLLAGVALMAPGSGEPKGPLWQEAGTAVAAIGSVLVVGRYGLNPLFSFLTRWGAREVMLIAALLVALGSASVLHLAGLSMALGAFIAGVLLAESSFRHTLEADIEPFRSLLMGLFFMAVGMTFALDVVFASWPVILAGVVLVMSVKGLLLWALARIFGASNTDALRIATTLPQGGEFAFVLFSSAAALNLMNQNDKSGLIAVVIVTMMMTPLVCAAYDRIAARLRARGVAPEVVESFEEAKASVLICGFGRFGMVAAQMLSAEGIAITAMDRNARRIDYARKLGYKVYYGDITRADVLRSAGADQAAVIALCVERDDIMRKAIDCIRENFHNARIYCRATDQAHAIDLTKLGVDFHVRETFESGILFGRAALEALAIPADRIATIEEDVRQRDSEVLRLQLTGGLFAGADILHARTPRKEPKHSEDA